MQHLGLYRTCTIGTKPVTPETVSSVIDTYLWNRSVDASNRCQHLKKPAGSAILETKTLVSSLPIGAVRDDLAIGTANHGFRTKKIGPYYVRWYLNCGRT